MLITLHTSSHLIPKTTDKVSNIIPLSDEETEVKEIDKLLRITADRQQNKDSKPEGASISKRKCDKMFIERRRLRR